MSTLRFTGLVKMMNRVREDLSHGIPAGQEENFRRMVTNTVRYVEQVCREHHTTPEKLPAPTYRAYSYLKEVDLKHLPVAQTPAQAAPKRLRVHNLISSCKAIQAQLVELSRSNLSKTKNLSRADPRLVSVHKEICRLADLVDEMLAQAGSDPDSLSSPSQRAYHWLRYLSKAHQFERHFSTMQLVQAEIKWLLEQVKSRNVPAEVAVHFELYNITAVYRASQERDFLRIEAHQAFAGAPRQVILALLWTILAGKSATMPDGSSSLEVVKAYSASKAYQKVVSALEGGAHPPATRTRGQHFDLQQVFERVNRTYFQSKMKAPALVWNKTLTHSKFGHYQPNTDTVMISISLDQASTPAHVIDYVMYHELLHRQMGTSSDGTRTYAHTKSFRQAEAKFPKQQQVESYLNDLSKHISRGKTWKSKK